MNVLDDKNVEFLYENMKLFCCKWYKKLDRAIGYLPTYKLRWLVNTLKIRYLFIYT